MTQYARPDSTEAAGVWENSNANQTDLETYIDDDPEGDPAFDDEDYIMATDNDGVVLTVKFGLSNVSDPNNAANHNVVVRANGTFGTTAVPDLKVELYLSNGSTKIADHTFTPSYSAFDSGVLRLSTSEADAISSYDNLQIWLSLIPADPGTGDWGSDIVSQAYFECDDAGAAPSTDNPAFLLFTGM